MAYISGYDVPTNYLSEMRQLPVYCPSCGGDGHLPGILWGKRECKDCMGSGTIGFVDLYGGPPAIEDIEKKPIKKPIKKETINYLDLDEEAKCADV